MKKYFTSILLLIVGILIAKTTILIGDGCYGFIDFVFLIFFILIYGVTLIIVIGVSYFKHTKKNQPFNFSPIWTTLIVFMLCLIAFNADSFKSSTVISAHTLNSKHYFSSLTIRKNNTFEIEVGFIEFSCFYKGKCIILNDTLNLNRNDIVPLTDSLFTSSYFIDQRKKLLYPLSNFDIADTTHWLTIVREE